MFPKRQIAIFIKRKIVMFQKRIFGISIKCNIAMFPKRQIAKSIKRKIVMFQKHQVAIPINQHKGSLHTY